MILVGQLIDDRNKTTIIDSIPYQPADSLVGNRRRDQRGSFCPSLSLSLPSFFCSTTTYVQVEFNIDRRDKRASRSAKGAYVSPCYEKMNWPVNLSVCLVYA